MLMNKNRSGIFRTDSNRPKIFVPLSYCLNAYYTFVNVKGKVVTVHEEEIGAETEEPAEEEEAEEYLEPEKEESIEEEKDMKDNQQGVADSSKNFLLEEEVEEKKSLFRRSRLDPEEPHEHSAYTAIGILVIVLGFVVYITFSRSHLIQGRKAN